MKKSKIFALILSTAMLLSGCAQESGNASSGNKSDSKSSQTAEKSTTADKGGSNDNTAQETTESASDEKPASTGKAPDKVENSILYFIDRHDKYLTFAIICPQGHDIGMHLEDKDGKSMDTWLNIHHHIDEDGDDWSVVYTRELQDQPLSELSLSVTDYSTANKDTIVFSDWGEEVGAEQKRQVGIYNIKGFDVWISDNNKTYLASGPTVGFKMSVTGYGKDEGTKEFSITGEELGSMFALYTKDGTPIEDYMGLGKLNYEVNDEGSIKALFETIVDDTDAEQKRLREAEPYLEFTDSSGVSSRIYNFIMQSNGKKK